MTRNQLAYWELVEKKRSNAAVEKETNRSNIAREVETNRHNLATEQETYRSNTVREKETERSNRANELLRDKQFLEQQRMNNLNYNLDLFRAQEQARSNLANEKLQMARNVISSAQMLSDSARVTEANRHNVETERFNLLQLSQKTRYDTIMANQSQQKIDEEMRSNLESENLRNTEIMLTYGRSVAATKGELSEKTRHNQSVEDETKRHNIVEELLQSVDSISRGIESGTRSIKNVISTFGGF